MSIDRVDRLPISVRNGVTGLVDLSEEQAEVLISSLRTSPAVLDLADFTKDVAENAGLDAHLVRSIVSTAISIALWREQQGKTIAAVIAGVEEDLRPLLTGRKDAFPLAWATLERRLVPLLDDQGSLGIMIKVAAFFAEKEVQRMRPANSPVHQHFEVSTWLDNALQPEEHPTRDQNRVDDLRHVRQELDRHQWILDLADDWDGEGAPGYARATWDRAVDFVLRAARQYQASEAELAPSPKLRPGPVGSIDVEWKYATRRLFVNVPADGRPLAYYGDDRGVNTTGGTIDSEKSGRWLLVWLTE